MLNIILIVLHLIASSLLMLFILLHAGRGGGLSDMFGGAAGGGSMAGSTVVERNLDRITVATAIIFTFTTILLALRLETSDGLTLRCRMNPREPGTGAPARGASRGSLEDGPASAQLAGRRPAEGSSAAIPLLGIALVVVLAAGAALAVFGAVRSGRKTSAAGAVGGVLQVGRGRSPEPRPGRRPRPQGASWSSTSSSTPWSATPGDLQPGPGLAGSFEANAEQTVFTFQPRPRGPLRRRQPGHGLRREVHPGAHRPQGLRLAAASPSSRRSAASPPSTRAGTAPGLAGIETPDAATVVVRLDRPFSSFPSVLGHPGFGIVPKAAVDRLGAAFKQTPGRVRARSAGSTPRRAGSSLAPDSRAQPRGPGRRHRLRRLQGRRRRLRRLPGRVGRRLAGAARPGRRRRPELRAAGDEPLHRARLLRPEREEPRPGRPPLPRGHRPGHRPPADRRRGLPGVGGAGHRAGGRRGARPGRQRLRRPLPARPRPGPGAAGRRRSRPGASPRWPSTTTTTPPSRRWRR